MTIHFIRRYIPSILIAILFLSGMAMGIADTWYMSGLFPARFRALSKDKKIALLRQIGIKSNPLRVRDILLSTYPNQPPEEHELAHLIGETAYTQYGPKGFDYCDSAFTFACFHGVILAAIKTLGYDEGILKTLSAECNRSGKNDTAKVSCAHGIGHGIMWVKNYSYIDSLGLCDRLFDDDKLRFFCWDGVSMENVVRRGDTAKGLSPVPWTDKDMYYPCDSVAAKYQPACVREHVFLVRLSLLGRDTEKSIAYCLHFTGDETHRECFGALGGALNQDDPTNPSHILAECNKIPNGLNVQCIGVAASHYAYSGDTLTAQDMCAAITTQQARGACMNAVKQVSGSLYMIQSL